MTQTIPIIIFVVLLAIVMLLFYVDKKDHSEKGVRLNDKISLKK